jgi:ATP-dependent Lon protease
MKVTSKEPFLRAFVSDVSVPPVSSENNVELLALEQNLKAATNEALKLLKLPRSDALVGPNVDPTRLAEVVCANLDISVSEKQEVLEQMDPVLKIKMVLQLLNREIEVLKASSDLQK